MKPAIRMGGGSIGNERFRQSEVQAWLAAHPERVAAGGERRISRQLGRARRSKPRDGLALMDVSSLLGVPTTAVSRLFAEGVLVAIDPNCKPHRMTITRRSLKRFAKAHATARVYVPLLGASSDRVSTLLAANGVRPIDPSAPEKHFIYRRADVRAAVGLKIDPDLEDAQGTEWFWHALRLHLISSGSKMRMGTSRRDGATLISSDRRTIVRLTADLASPSLTIEMRCDQRSHRRFKVLAPLIGEIGAAWAQAEITGSLLTGSIRIRETLGLATLETADSVEQALAWIESRLAGPRLILARRQRDTEAVAS